MELTEFNDLFNKIFIPAYADLVALLGDKPQEIGLQLENALMHLMVYLDDKKDKDTREKNLEKAHGHIIRASLDCYKMAWGHMFEVLEYAIEKDGYVYFNLDKSELIALKHSISMKAKEARKSEMEGIGQEHIKTLDLYRDMLEEIKKLDSKFDYDKFKNHKRSKMLYIFKNHSVGFVVGVVSSIVATLLWKFFIKS